MDRFNAYNSTMMQPPAEDIRDRETSSSAQNASSRGGITLRAALLIAAACLAYQLLLPPVAGIADNGDFGRLISMFGLDHASTAYQTRYFNYVDLEYHFVEAPHYRELLTSLRSSELIPIAIAVAGNHLLSKTGGFDIRAIGLVHAAAFLLLVFWLWPLLPQSPPWRSWLIGLAGLTIFLDVAYLSYFNSFYGEPACYLTLLGLTAVCVRSAFARRLDFRGTTLLVLLAAAFVTAKAQTNISAPLVALLVALWILWFYRGPRLRVAACAALLVLIAAGLAYWRYPVQHRKVNLFSSIYGGIIFESRNRAADFAALGLEPSLESYLGANVWDPAVGLEGPYLAEHFFARTSYARVVWFYISHPDRFARNASAAIAASYHLRDGLGLGQLEHQAGILPDAKNRALRLWSSLRAALGVFPFLATLLIVAVFGATLIATASWPLRTLQIFLALLAVSQFLTAVMGEGPGNMEKHLFLCDLAVDILLFWALVHFTQRTRKSRSQLGAASS